MNDLAGLISKAAQTHKQKPRYREKLNSQVSGKKKFKAEKKKKNRKMIFFFFKEEDKTRLQRSKKFYKSTLCEASINCKCRCLPDNLSSQITGKHLPLQLIDASQRVDS